MTFYEICFSKVNNPHKENYLKGTKLVSESRRVESEEGRLGMRIILHKKYIELSPEKAQALKDEMRFACNQVSVFPIMEEILALM